MKPRQLFGLLGFVVIAAAVPLSNAQVTTKVPISDDVKTLVQGNNEFAFDLFAKLAEKEKGNIVFSPYSISNALAMTYGGARGKTAEEMAKVLHLSLPPDRLHASFGDLIGQLQGEQKGRPFDLFIANALWPGRGRPLRDDFTKLTRDCYRASVQELDYQGNPDKSREIINSWVEDKTKGKIKDLVGPPDVNAQTLLVLTNAIYFKASWANPFQKTLTKDTPFEVNAKEKPLVPMMHSEQRFFDYASLEDFALVDLPYKGDRLSMVLLLPKERGKLDGLIKSLSAHGLSKSLLALKPHMGQVVFPRFRLMTDRIDLIKPLRELGMQIAFDAGADFSGIPASHIGSAIHKAFIDVDEIGTEAAAATAVGFPVLGGASFSFQADRPFLFLIRDTGTGSVLFIGRVEDPSRGS